MSQINPKKNSPQYYILSSTTIHCRSLPLRKPCNVRESALKLFKFLFSSSNFFTFHIFYNCLHVSVECFIHEFLSFYLKFSCFILFDVEERYFYFIFTNIQRQRVILNFSQSYRFTWPRLRGFQYFKPNIY